MPRLSGSFQDKLESLRTKGYVRAKINGVMTRLDSEITLAKTKKHSISIVMDRVVLRKSCKNSLCDRIWAKRILW